jgi:hypothetical protein
MSAVLEDIEARAEAAVAAVADDPEGRYRLRAAFYHRFGFGSGAGFGTSELQFLRWEIARGVLNPLTGAAPGSAWWRDVNATLLFHAECAAGLFATGETACDDPATDQWLSYLHRPSAHAWYRAHNASIVSGYLEHREAARREISAERVFMNMVLYRLLYAQALVEGDAPGIMGWISRLRLGRVVSALERVIADPRSPAVDMIVHLPDFYPQRYPLDAKELHFVLERGHCPGVLVEEMFDKGLIAPALHELYLLASNWLQLPRLCGLVAKNTPIYPDSYPAS